MVDVAGIEVEAARDGNARVVDYVEEARIPVPPAREPFALLFNGSLFHSVRTASADRVREMAAPRRHLALVCF